ncbi:RNA polymerase sigma-70 factor [Mycobacterium lepraemurium]|nr:RNA polymerase sigma factor SigI [Mycobacterium lepraemurium]ATA27218.1 RNA polymerase sigma-70 factor [Mycobacterium lepraemurium]
MNRSPSADDQVAGSWRRHRPYLVNLAYQMLGDIGDAEDVAQEAFLRLSAAGEIDDVRGWLTVVASRLCLDQLRSARARNERPGDVGEQPAPPRSDPADRITLDDEVRTALLEVLRRLSPGGSGSASCCTTCSGCPSRRSRRPWAVRLAPAATITVAAQPKLNTVGAAEHQLVTEKFITACANGDLAGLVAVLDPTVWGVGTVLADPAPPPQVNYGPDAVATNLLRYLWPDVTLVGGLAGAPVLLAFNQRRLFAVIVLSIRDVRVVKIEAIADPAARSAG